MSDPSHLRIMSLIDACYRCNRPTRYVNVMTGIGAATVYLPIDNIQVSVCYDCIAYMSNPPDSLDSESESMQPSRPFLIDAGHLTPEQIATIDRLTNGLSNYADFTHPFDLPSGWVSGWAQGVYYGIDPTGQAHS